MEQIVINREKQPDEPLSPLYPPHERPVARARMLVRDDPGFRSALENRLTEALYKNRALPEIIFPHEIHPRGIKVPRGKRILPTFDHLINAEVFAEEEAIEITRFARQYLYEQGNTDPSEAEIAKAIDDLYKNGELTCADQKQITREEEWRRHLLVFADSLRQGKPAGAEEIAEELSRGAEKAARNPENPDPMVADHFRWITIPLIEDAIRNFHGAYPELLGVFSLASRCTFIPQDARAHARLVSEAQRVLDNSDARTALGQEFLRTIIIPSAFAALMAAWKGYYGISRARLNTIIKDCVPDYVARRAIQNEKVDVKKFEEAIGALEKCGILSAEECRSEGFGLFARMAAAEMEKRNKKGNPLNWEPFFLDWQRRAVDRDYCTARDFPLHPYIQRAAEKLLVVSFEGGDSVLGLQETASQLHNLNIMTYHSAMNHDAIVAVVAKQLKRIFTDPSVDSEKKEEDYLAALHRYVTKAGIGRRVDFDNIPEIADARNAPENQKS